MTDGRATNIESRIECHPDLGAYFGERLSRALKAHRPDAPEPTQSYLVRLLSKLGHGAARLSRTLVDLSLEMQRTPRAERVSKLRAIGDQALSTSGLFEANLERRGISPAYVADMGSGAYRSAGQLASASARDDERLQAGVFWDLSHHFQAYARVLREVRESTSLGTSNDVLSLYERYMRTRSPAVLERLAAYGVWLAPDLSRAAS